MKDRITGDLGIDLGIYEAMLINLGVSPVDAQQATKRLAKRIARLSSLPRKVRKEEKEEIRRFFGILGQVFEKSIKRVENLFQIGINPYDKQLGEFCESQGNLGVAFYLVACDTAATLSQLLRPGRTIVTPADLVHPNQNVQGNNPPFSLVGAYKISELLGIPPSSDLNLGRAMGCTIPHCFQVGDIPSGEILDEAILTNVDLITKKGGWRWFVPNVLLPVRQEVGIKYFSRF
jgi:hypothetical protein